MKFESIRIKNFRTIDSELTVNMSCGLTIVGPNSSGKTNILKAIEMFFTGFENEKEYLLDRDLPAKLESGQTSLVGTIILEDSDSAALKLYNEINQCLDVPKKLTRVVVVYLTFSKSGNPNYRLFSGEKHNVNKTKNFNRYQESLLNIFFDSFECHYVSSVKNIDNLYQELLLPSIKLAISEILNEKIQEISLGLGEISKEIDHQFASVGLSHIKSKFKLPNDSLRDLLTSFEYHLSDPVETEIARKGMGIQSIAIFAAFTWITQEEKKLGKKSIWLIEEPESYLHPELADSCKMMLNKLTVDGHLIRTTHNLNFVPQDPKRVIGTKVENGYTKTFEFDTYTKATKSIRDSLGVKFSDFCNLGLLNIFVEGKTDRELFQWVLSKVKVKATGKYSWDNVRNADFLDFGGTSALEGFMKATYGYVSEERAVVVVFDGDDAGDKARKNLQGFLGNKSIAFQANKHFIMLREGFSIEGQFPESWLIEAYDSHPNWFNDFAVDIDNKLRPFSTKNETTKNQLREFLKRKAEEQTNDGWAENFIKVFEVIDHGLEDINNDLAIRANKGSLTCAA